MKIKDLLKHNPDAEIVLTLKRDGRTTFFGCGALAEISLKDTDTPYLEFVLVDNAPDHVLQKNLELILLLLTIWEVRLQVLFK